MFPSTDTTKGVFGFLIRFSLSTSILLFESQKNLILDFEIETYSYFWIVLNKGLRLQFTVSAFQNVFCRTLYLRFQQSLEFTFIQYVIILIILVLKMFSLFHIFHSRLRLFSALLRNLCYCHCFACSNKGSSTKPMKIKINSLSYPYFHKSKMNFWSNFKIKILKVLDIFIKTVYFAKTICKLPTYLFISVF
jgi:hypothetical protein